MAENIFEIQEITPGQIQTQLTLSDQTVITELHRTGISDQDILMKFNQKYYKHLPGLWRITFPREHKSIKDNDLGKAIQMALAYIHDRNNPDYTEFFF